MVSGLPSGESMAKWGYFQNSISLIRSIPSLLRINVYAANKKSPYISKNAVINHSALLVARVELCRTS
jgi:hypothetical protein